MCEKSNFSLAGSARGQCVPGAVRFVTAQTRSVTLLQCKSQFVGMGRQPMPYALHPTNNCPAPLDPGQLCKFQFSALLHRTKSLPLEGKVARRKP